MTHPVYRNAINGEHYVCIGEAVPNIGIPALKLRQMGIEIAPVFLCISPEDISEVCDRVGLCSDKEVFGSFARSVLFTEQYGLPYIRHVFAQTKARMCASVCASIMPPLEKIAHLRFLLAVGFQMPEFQVLHDQMMEIETERLRRTAAARAIQRAYRIAIADPTHELCRMRLLNEFSGMCEEIRQD